MAPAQYRKTASASDKASALSVSAPFLASELMPRGGTLSMLDGDALASFAKNDEPEMAVSTPSTSGTAAGGEAVAANEPTVATGKRKAGQGSGSGNLKFVTVASLMNKPVKTLVAAIKWRADDLNAALHELARKKEQYDKWKGDAAELLRISRELEGALDIAVREAAAAKSAVEIMTERLSLFDDAAAVLAEAGLSDVPSLYAANIVRGDIAAECIFSRFMSDAMHAFEQRVPETRRLSAGVKDWLAFAEAQPSAGVSALTSSFTPFRPLLPSSFPPPPYLRTQHSGSTPVRTAMHGRPDGRSAQAWHDGPALSSPEDAA